MYYWPNARHTDSLFVFYSVYGNVLCAGGAKKECPIGNGEKLTSL